MPALTKTQLEHAKTRIAAAKAAYIHRETASLGVEPDVTEYDDEQKISMIHAGAAVLKPITRRTYGELTNFFTYVDTPEMAAARERHKVWTVSSERVTAEADAKEQSLLDELIMSPDGKAALEKIAATFA